MIIYKYLDEKGAVKTIQNNSVILRTPSEFNDPFDCFYYISKRERHKAFKLFMNYQFFKLLYDEMIINGKKLVFGESHTRVLSSNLKAIAKSLVEKKRYKWMPDIAFYYKIAKYINQKSDDEYLIEFNKRIDEVVGIIKQSLLVSCFSLRNDSILMWSHYANSHHGACVEYEIDDNDFMKVKYSKKPLRFQLSKALGIIFGHEFSKAEIDYSDRTFFFAAKPILKKFKDWKYEKEIRCIYSFGGKHPRIHKDKDDSGKQIWLFDMPVKIKRIYIGSNADDSFIEDIKNECGDTPLTKMHISEGKYGLMPDDKQP